MLSYSGLFFLISFFGFTGGWRAIPANQATFAAHTDDLYVRQGDMFAHLQRLPRKALHSIYKFGFCTPAVVVRQFLRKTLNISFETFRDANIQYLYFVSDMATQRFKMQCVVMKFYAPRRFTLFNSRLPLYYCQGQVLIMMFDTVHRLAIHEFYIPRRIYIPMDIFLEFYHPNLPTG